MERGRASGQRAGLQLAMMYNAAHGAGAEGSRSCRAAWRIAAAEKMYGRGDAEHVAQCARALIEAERSCCVGGGDGGEDPSRDASEK